MVQAISNTRRFRQNPKEFNFVQNPYSLYAKMHAIGGPVYWDDYHSWCLVGFDDVDMALRDKRFKRLKPPGETNTAPPEHLTDFSRVERYSLLAMEAPEHTRLRKRVNAAFMSRQVLQLTDDISAKAHSLIDQFESTKSVELLQHYIAPIPIFVITHLLGIPIEAGPNLLAWSRAMVKVYTLTQSLEDEIAANTAAREFEQFLLEVIKERRKHPASDLLSLLVAVDGDEPLNDAEIVSICVLLLNAGHEATVHQIGNSVRCLLLQSGTPADFFCTEKSSDATVLELLRYDAPLHLFQRYAQQDIELASDVTLNRGDAVSLLLGAANRDPRKFHEPHVFNSGRTDANHVSLGAGVHFCVGAALAKLEIKVALRTLFTRLPTLALDGETEYLDLYHFHGLKQLRVRW